MFLRRHAKSLGILALLLACGGILWVAWSAPAPESDGEPVAEEKADEPDPYEDAALTGRLLDPEGEAVTDGTVMVHRAGVPSSAHTVRTDKHGRYGFADLPAGRWRVDAAAPGLLSPGPQQVRALTVDVDDETSLEVDLTLRRAGHISGRVVAGGKGLPGLPIDLHYSAATGVAGKLDPYVSRRAGTTGDDGRFSLDVAPGTFTLVVRHRQKGERESASVTLADGARRSGLRIDFAPGGRLEGKVTSTTGQVLRVAVELRGGGLQRPRRVQSDPSGHYQFKHVPAGRYMVSAKATGFNATEREVVVRPKAVTTQNLVLSEARGVVGRVVDGNDQPVRRARVVLNWGAAEITVYSDDAGKFRWRRDGVPAETVRAKAFSPQHAPSEWVSAAEDRMITLVLRAGGYISGTVVGPDGVGVVPAAVVVTAMDVPPPNPYKPRELPQARAIDRRGSFRLGPLRPGRYTLRGESQKHSPGEVTDILVTAEHTTANVEIKLGRGGIVHGVVRDPNGDPVEGASVVLWVPKAVLPPRTAATGPDGSYRITGLPRGRFSLRVHKPGYLTALSSGVELEDGADVERDLTIRKRRKGERFAFQGIGATLMKRGSGIVVGNLIAGSPAKGAGLRTGDVITSVDGRGTSRKSIREVVELIRGEPESAVSLQISRGGQPMQIEIIRGEVVMKAGARRPRPHRQR